MIDGDLVVDLHGGVRDRAGNEPWTGGALPCVYSSGKAVMAVLVARLVSDGALDYEAPVAGVWPNFAAAGKGDVTLAMALSHQAGLCGFKDEMPPASWLDHGEIVGRLARLAPLWSPGEASGYHPQTIGFIVGELIARAAGDSLGGVLYQDHYKAYGADVHCGVRPDVRLRVAEMRKPPRAPDLGELTELKEIAFLKPWSSPARVDREDWLAAEIPASNMHASARGLAAVVHPLANEGAGPGGPAIDPAVVRDALRIRIEGDDLVLPFRIAWAAGLMRNDHGWYGPARDAFGHAGFGGSCVLVDPARRLSAAFVMNKMSPHLVGDPRPKRLLDAVYEALDG